VRVGYRREGSGPPLVCHPGGPGFSSLYLGDLAGLGDRFELILVDPRGTAATPRPPDSDAYAIADYVDDLEELRAGLGLEQLNLLGHSHGGVVAMAYAAAHPGRLRRLVLASTLPRFSPVQEAAMTAAMQTREREPWYEDACAALEAEQAGDFETDEELRDLALREFPFYFARFGEAEQAYLDTLRAETPNADALLLFNREIFSVFDLRPELGRIDVPTLVIAGELDFITGPIAAEEIAEGIAGAEKVILPDTGHFIFVEARASFRAEVTRWLA
jgi:pimeloyl-ACP methyl ester carboxylesterase